MTAQAHKVGYKVFSMMPGSMRRRIVKAVKPSYSVGALAVILDGQGNAVMCRQPHTTGWTLPGGLLEKNEAPEVTLHREIAEEVGVPAERLGLPSAPSTAHVDYGRGRLDLIYYGHLDRDALDGAQGTDGIEVAWRPLTEPDVIVAGGEILEFVRTHLSTL